MHNIYHLLEKFLLYFKRKSLKKSIIYKKYDKNIADSLSFSLCENNDINIHFKLPEIKNKSNEEIASIAENYASFLLSITSGEINQKMCEILTDQVDSNSDPNMVLFVDNIISFWIMLHKDRSKKGLKKYDQSQPLIRPTQVFRQ
jgi:hypothetical protein